MLRVLVVGPESLSGELGPTILGRPDVDRVHLTDVSMVAEAAEQARSTMVIIDLPRDEAVGVVRRLRDNPATLHVRFVSDMEDRVAWAQRDLKCDEDEAREAVKESDNQSRKYLDYYFKVNPDLPGHYSVTFNTSRVSRDSCVDILETLVKRLSAE